jgi:hypothetical protein
MSSIFTNRILFFIFCSVIASSLLGYYKLRFIQSHTSTSEFNNYLDSYFIIKIVTLLFLVYTCYKLFT